MRFSTTTLGALLIAASATPAFAQETAPPPPITVNATAAVVTDYRFRGISQTDNNAAIQGSITLTHKSGFYVSVWGSSVDDYVTVAGTGHQEIDIIGGYSHTFGGIKLDGGVLYYFYPKTKLAGDRSSSDFFEPYVDVSTTLGPVTAKATVNYAPTQKALALDQGASGTLKKRDNVYTAGDFTVAIPKTPFGLTAHVAHSFGPSWLATDSTGKKGYTDWALGATATYKVLTLGVSYVDTDAKFLSATKNVSKSGVVATLTASF
ncbi:MAG: TorF family putative porin [Sphingomonas sp.]|jgi:uncharacterized protein (TIGR02001 family)|uniref:TorF family putative porin n=1 Tax=Sphingomonas sp. TaxID=28214 RepID=UPI00356B1044